MYSIEEYRTHDPIYAVERGVNVEYRKEDLVREVEAEVAVNRASHRAWIAVATCSKARAAWDRLRASVLPTRSRGAAPATPR